MKRLKLLMFAIFSLVLMDYLSLAQSYNLDVKIINQPHEYVRLESVSGDNYSILDSVLAENGEVHFEIPTNAHVGVYRLVLGKTGYARVMNQDPQMLDFIFNKENIQLKTDFKNPLQAVQVIHSDENRIYFDFLVRLKEYEKLLTTMEQEADNYWEKGDSTKAINASNEFNRLQLDWDLKTAQTSLKDAFLSPKERNENFRNEFLKTVDFSDEALIYSTAYTDKIFEFLTLFNQPDYNQHQRTVTYIDAVDRIFSKMGKNEQVDHFITDYLLHGFHVLGMKEVIDHINEKTR